jgi:hypothetical protein
MENLCLNIYFSNNVYGPYTFLYDSEVNNRKSWYCELYDLRIAYNNDAKYWEVLNIETIINAKLRNVKDLETPIGYWTIVGVVPNGDAIVTSGSCSTYSPISLSTKVANNTCPNKCNGTIFASAIGDQKPYNFSINDGVTYTSNPIFNNLCQGEYSIKVSGQTGSVANKLVTVNFQNSNKIYNIKLETISTPILPYDLKETIWGLTINPPLTDGDVISVNLLNDAETIISQPGSGTTINNTKVYKNGIQIQPTTISSTSKEEDRINCFPYKDITKLSGITYSIVVSGGTSVSGNTISSIDIYNKEISDNGCQTNITQTNVIKIVSASVANCECCSVNFDSTNYVGINKHFR